MSEESYEATEARTFEDHEPLLCEFELGKRVVAARLDGSKDGLKSTEEWVAEVVDGEEQRGVLVLDCDRCSG